MFKHLLLTALFVAPLQAQIYADFTVSSGGNPLGTFRVLLEHGKAPRTCANFIGLASGKRPWVDLNTGAVRTNKPYYNGLTFHRLIHSFVIQGGSPNGQGTDGPGYSILDEYHPNLDHSQQYVLSMAKGGFPNTGGSQFFITLRATPELDNKHSVFGTVISGTEIIDGFKNSENFPVGAGNKPTTPITMDSVVISGPDYAGFDVNAASLRLPAITSTNFQPIRNTAASTFTMRFNRRPKSNYYFLASTNLAQWTPSANIFSFDAETAFDATYNSVTGSRFFVNVATTDYALVPDAPADLVTAERTVRITYPDGSRLELTLTPDFSVWEYADATGNPLDGGFLSGVIWEDQSPATGTTITGSPTDYDLPLGRLQATFDRAAGPDSILSLNTWLSFHTETTGWLEETEPPSFGTDAIRLPFQILPN